MNGLDVRDLHPDALHRAIGLVPQKPFLFSGTVASNVRFGDPDAPDSAVWRALEIAQARDFVAAMPGGLDARIAQGGTNVSGGQRQRLAIARALAHHPDIYLFDDSFSALDLATDAPAARRARTGRHRRGERHRRPAGLDDRACRPDPRPRAGPPGRARHARRAASRRARPTRRSSSRSSSPGRRWREHVSTRRPHSSRSATSDDEQLSYLQTPTGRRGPLRCRGAGRALQGPRGSTTRLISYLGPERSRALSRSSSPSPRWRAR